jgi:cell division protein FtsB
MVGRIYAGFHDLFHRPMRVLWICIGLALIGVVLDGTAFRLWSLKRDHRVLIERIASERARSKQLGFRIQTAQQPEFIEKAARDQFDLVKEGDLIFIFSDELSEGSDKTEQAKY